MMNERIRELVRESNLDVYGLGKERYKWEYTVEKFAELIIAECCVALHPMLRDMISRSRGVDLIVEHFRDKE
jgi:hypothetical protein